MCERRRVYPGGWAAQPRLMFRKPTSDVPGLSRRIGVRSHPNRGDKPRGSLVDKPSGWPINNTLSRGNLPHRRRARPGPGAIRPSPPCAATAAWNSFGVRTAGPSTWLTSMPRPQAGPPRRRVLGHFADHHGLVEEGHAGVERLLGIGQRRGVIDAHPPPRLRLDGDDLLCPGPGYLPRVTSMVRGRPSRTTLSRVTASTGSLPTSSTRPSAS